MKKYLRIILIGILVLAIGCKEDDEPSYNNEESFLPMHIGNYWKNDEENFTEIIDTLRIEGNLYYKFYSLIGGDGISTQYLRIDENQQLIESYPNSPNDIFIHAKFSADKGSTFWTLNNQSVNDFKVTVLKKENTLRTFEFQRMYHPNANDSHTVTYVKGLGWNNYKEVKIDGTLYTF